MNNPKWTPLKSSHLRFLIRVSAFLRKEIFEIMRQPLLVLTLVLGPFLILFFFGIGYRNEARPLRTLFVVEPDTVMARNIEHFASTLGPQLIYAGITGDLEEAQEKLQQGEVDLIAEVPADAYQTILNNQQAVFRLFHREIDPFQTDYIGVFGRVYVNEVNRRVLHYITTEGQTDISNAQVKLDAARASAATLQELLEECAKALSQPDVGARCDSETAREYLRELDRKVDDLELSARDSLMLIDAVRQGVGDDGNETGDSKEDESRQTLADVIDNTNTLGELGETADEYIANLRTLTQLQDDLDELQTRLTEFIDIDPTILISPFRSEVSRVGTIQINVTDFFAPAVIVLLLQHLTVTFAALSMVRERLLGAMELFYVAPLSALETLLGKYISYLLFGAVLSAILMLLVTFGLGAPFLGAWWGMVLVIAALLFTSLGIGFVISLVSTTDTQAVQYSMIVLLTSVFFSGFILGLETLWQPVRVISWALPATYGISLLRGLMLLGDPLAWDTLLQLTAIGVGFFGLAWFLLRRSMAHS